MKLISWNHDRLRGEDIEVQPLCINPPLCHKSKTRISFSRKTVTYHNSSKGPFTPFISVDAWNGSGIHFPTLASLNVHSTIETCSIHSERQCWCYRCRLVWMDLYTAQLKCQWRIQDFLGGGRQPLSMWRGGTGKQILSQTACYRDKFGRSVGRGGHPLRGGDQLVLGLT